jgi:sugar (pentulose or hexulose) kinase
MAAGVFADAAEAVAACVHPAGIVEPDAAWAAAYPGALETYRALYPALRDVPRARA